VLHLVFGCLDGFGLVVFGAEVNVYVFEGDVVVFEVLFGHFTPDASAEGVNENLVFTVTSSYFNNIHNKPRKRKLFAE
jgi:hypothetical protein